MNILGKGNNIKNGWISIIIDRWVEYLCSKKNYYLMVCRDKSKDTREDGGREGVKGINVLRRVFLKW